MSRFYRYSNIKPYNIKFSQNFIKSEKLSREVVNQAHLKKNDLVIEIGPGKGSITEHIVNSGAKLIAVEMDSNLAENLKNIYKGEDIEVVNDDFLNFQLPNKSYKLIGNIPFALTTKIIKKLLDYANPPEETLMIVQKEAANRLMGNDLLSLKFKPWFKFKVVRNLNPDDFYPVPSVKPVLLKISKHDFPLIDFQDRVEYNSFLTYCFLNSKNGLRTSLRKIFTFNQLGIISKRYNLKSKPSELGFEKWVSLFQEYKRLVNEDKKRFVRDSSKSFENKQVGIKKVYRSWVSKRI